MTISYGSSALADYIQTGRHKRQLRRTFDRVLQPRLVDLLLSEPDRLKLGGETRELTVLFSDLKGSTALSERYSPGEWVDCLNQYFSECTQIILDRNGYLDKYVGDGIMAVWGAPVAERHHAVQACLAALELRDRLTEVRSVLFESFGADLVTRIGINSGEMLVGMVGGQGLSHYTVMGETVNVASRLEGANDVYGSKILIGQNTYEKVKDAVEVREIDLVVLRGKSEAMHVYEPICPRGKLDDSERKLLENFGQGLKYYRSREWQAGIKCFQQVLAGDPHDGPARVLIERCRSFRKKEPPAGWRGAFVM
jgi:adenylate cyclase